jgi:hypothetical protein
MQYVEPQSLRRFVVVIIGPPAVGKMTVGQALAQRTGFPLLHNHVVADMVATFFPVGTPEFTQLNKQITTQLVTELLRAYPAGLILTRTHDFDNPRDAEMMSLLLALMTGGGTGSGTEFGFVELTAPLDIRLVRNRTENRLAQKPSKRDLVESEARVRRNDSRRFQPPDGVLPWPGRRLQIDNSEMLPAEVAARIAEEWFPPNPPQPPGPLEHGADPHSPSFVSPRPAPSPNPPGEVH